jgi:UDP:flavonoid glycosyltransferase YjiC (YdhE family)
VLAPAPFLAGLARFGSWYGRMTVALARRATNGWMAPVYELRRELGLPGGGHPLFEGQYSPALTLALFSRVLAEPQPDWPPHVRITGFVFYNGPDGLPPELETFLNAGSPPVVFTLGSSAVAAAGRFYDESLAAIRRLGIRAVLLTGGFEQNRPPGAVSDGVLFVDRAPHQLLFSRAAAVVHPGGAGTLGQALRAGKPMLIVPHAHDQPDNASRAKRLGVAEIVTPRKYRGPRIARELGRLLTEARYAARAAEAAAAVRSEGGASAAAAAIGALCT